MESAPDKSTAGSPTAPVLFGKYMFLGLIARGGMAEVFRGRSRNNNRLFAIKCMRPQLAKEARFVEMFVREGKLAVLLEHPNIVRTFEIGRNDGRYFIAMEYIGGKDLTQILRRCQEQQARIPVPHACYIAAKMSEGLHYAHTLNDADGRPLAIVNRDVSPSNVRIGFDGEVKLLDFGIAQAMVKFTSEIGVLKGKFSYMSPEQIRGMPVDARTDVFSTGIVLHEMLTTEKLYRGDTEFQLMERVRNAEVVPPSKYNRRVPEELDRVVMKALARDVADRYQSGAELATDLHKFLASYRFNPAELVDHLRGLYKTEYEREAQEILACQQAPFPSAEDRDASLIVQAGSLSVSMSTDAVSMVVIQDDTSPEIELERETKAAAPVAPTSPPSPAVSPAAPVAPPIPQPVARQSDENPQTNPSRPGLWARLRGKLRGE